MKVTFDTPITILHVLTFARVLRYGFVMKRKPYQLCDDIIGEIRNMLDAPTADQPAATETGTCPGCRAEFTAGRRLGPRRQPR